MQSDEYRKLAELEDQMWYFHGLHRRFSDVLERSLPKGPAQVLDAGCGTGGLIKRLRQGRPDWNFTGLDFMPQACELARARTGVRIVEGSITALPFDSGQFDAVLAADVVCQVHDAAGAVREFARCVRPGGVVVVNVPAFRWLWSYHDDTSETRHRYLRGEMTDLFRQAGLEVCFASYANSLPLAFIVLRRKILRRRNRASDIHLYPRPVEAFFAGVAAGENAWLRRGWPLPLGSSVFVIGRRPLG